MLLALITALMVGWGAVRLRGTTLLAPALWAFGSVAALATVELLLALDAIELDPRHPLRYAVAVSTVCPMMAVLGAKRPQDRAWQWVVLALLATLWLPAAKCLLLDRGAPMEVSLAWRVFLIALVTLGPLNYLPTRNWPSALLVVAGQCILLVPYVAPTWTADEDLSAALALFIMATCTAWIRRWLPNRVRDVNAASGRVRDLDAQWQSFRDAFGAFWAIRVMQRVNQGLRSSTPSVSLTWRGWRGFVNESDGLKRQDAAVAQAEKLMRTALRRFVSTLK